MMVDCAEFVLKPARNDGIRWESIDYIEPTEVAEFNK